jgi:hypothetical protein
VKTKFPKLTNRTLYVVQYADGREFINREPLTREERADLKKDGHAFREKRYRLAKG